MVLHISIRGGAWAPRLLCVCAPLAGVGIQCGFALRSRCGVGRGLLTAFPQGPETEVSPGRLHTFWSAPRVRADGAEIPSPGRRPVRLQPLGEPPPTCELLASARFPPVPPGSPHPDPVLSFLQTQSPQLPTQLSVPPLLASEEKEPLPRICPLP